MMCYCRCQSYIVKLLQQMPCMQSAAQLCLIFIPQQAGCIMVMVSSAGSLLERVTWA